MNGMGFRWSAGIVGGTVLGFSTMGCGSDSGRGADSDTVGTLSAKLMSASPHDVTQVYYRVVASDQDCSGVAVAEAVSALEAEALPGSLAPEGSSDTHRFSDALFTLEPGTYRLCATPLAMAGYPSLDCAPTETLATVVPNVTTEVVLVSQCTGDSKGGLDGVVVLNDPPVIDNVTITPSKFVTTCEDATLTASVSDPDGDEIATVAWQLLTPGATLTSMGTTATFRATTPGDYQVEVVATDANGGVGSLTVPIHVTAGGTGCGLSGETGTTWELVAPAQRGLQAWVPAGDTRLFFGSGTAFGVIDLMSNATTFLATPPRDLGSWGSPALSLGAIWEIRPSNVVRYDIGADTWSMVRSDLHPGDDQAMTVTADDSGNLWSHDSAGEIVRYNPVSDSVTYFPTGLGSEYETRLGFDGSTNAIFFGGFATPQLFRLDIATGAVMSVSPIPELALNDIFCSDHNGHIYAAGDFGGTTLWQYRVDSDTWIRIPDLPVDHGNNGSCGVVADGYLYVENSFSGSPGLYRLQLL